MNFSCRVVIASTLAAAVLACNQRTSHAPSSLLPVEATVTILRLVAPAQIAPGESRKLSAIAHTDGGSSLDVTHQSEWTSSESVLQVTSAGVVSGRAPGQAVITVRYGGHETRAKLLVLPHGTFHLIGIVTRDGGGVADVLVTVIAGIGEGLTARTDAKGEFHLYGVAGNIQIEARRDGDLIAVHPIYVESHGTMEFQLSPERGREFVGRYTMEIEAANCQGNFPEIAKRRTYVAVVEHAGTGLRVSLSGADIWRGSGVFSGTVSVSGEVKFTIRPAWWWDYEAFDLVENIGGGLSVIVQGSIAAVRTPRGIIGIPYPDPNAGDRLGIRLNQQFGGWCTITRFDLLRVEDAGR